MKKLILIFLLMIPIVFGATLYESPKWDIQQSGNELNLKVTPIELSKGITVFCIEYNSLLSKETYKINNELSAKPTDRIPITNLVKDSILELPTYINLDSKDADCITVTYGDDNSNVHFKIGWESVTVDGDAYDFVLRYGEMQALFQEKNGNMTVIYQYDASHISRATSDDMGLTWNSEVIITDSTFNGLSGGSYMNGSTFLYYFPPGDGKAYWFEYAGGSWNSNDLTTTPGGEYLVCDIEPEGNDVLQCLSMDTNDEVQYVNSSEPSTLKDLGYDFLNPNEMCTIQVYESCPYAFCFGSADDIWLNSPCTGGWTTSNTIYTGGSMSTIENGYTIDAEILNGSAYVTFIDTTDLWYCNFSLSNIAETDCKEIDAGNSYYPDIYVNENGTVQILYMGATTGYVLLANSTDFGETWDYRFQEDASSGSRHPVFEEYYPWSNMTYQARYVYLRDTGAHMLIYNDTNVYPYSDYQGGEACSPDMQYTEWTYNGTQFCWINDTMNSTYSRIYYDANECGGANTTYYSIINNETCDYCQMDLTNTTYSLLSDNGCWINDTTNKTYGWIEYDLNYSSCYLVTGLPDDTWNGGVNLTWDFDIFNETCNNCSYSPINTTWFYNGSIGCLANNTQNDSYYKIEYDQNNATCYAVTLLETDLWNNGNNDTHYNYIQNTTCQINNTLWFNYTVSEFSDYPSTLTFTVYTNGSWWWNFTSLSNYPTEICYAFFSNKFLCINETEIYSG